MKSSPHAHSHGVRSITFVLALSIHSVIEGIAFGVGVMSAAKVVIPVKSITHLFVLVNDIVSRTTLQTLRHCSYLFLSIN